MEKNTNIALLARIDHEEKNVDDANKKRHKYQTTKEFEKKDLYGTEKTLNAEQSKYEERKAKHERISNDVDNI